MVSTLGDVGRWSLDERVLQAPKISCAKCKQGVNSSPGRVCLALPPRIPDCRRFRDKALQQRDAMRGYRAVLHRLPDRAVGLAVMAAIAETAMTEQRSKLDECLGDSFRIDVREAEHLEARRVDDPPAAVTLGHGTPRQLAQPSIGGSTSGDSRDMVMKRSAINAFCDRDMWPIQ